MAYDEELANRIRELLGTEKGVEEKRMFGGLAFLINGNMAVAASGRGGLMVRVPPEETEKLLGRAARRTHGDGRQGDQGLAAGGRRRRHDQTPTALVGRPRCRPRQVPTAEVSGTFPRRFPGKPVQMARSTHQEQVKRLLKVAGRTYADEAGIRLRNKPMPLFQPSRRPRGAEGTGAAEHGQTRRGAGSRLVRR